MSADHPSKSGCNHCPLDKGFGHEHDCAYPDCVADAPLPSKPLASVIEDLRRCSTLVYHSDNCESLERALNKVANGVAIAIRDLERLSPETTTGMGFGGMEKAIADENASMDAKLAGDKTAAVTPAPQLFEREWCADCGGITITAGVCSNPLCDSK